MTNLINITSTKINNQQVNTVNARELHSFLQNKRQFADWIKQRIEQYGFICGEDYVFHKFVKNPTEGGRPTLEYSITLDMAKELAMVENNAKGKQARRYFIEVEKEYKNTLPNNKIPKNYIATLELLGKAIKENKQLIKELNRVKSKLKLLPKVVVKEEPNEEEPIKLISVAEASYYVGLSQRRLSDLICANKDTLIGVYELSPHVKRINLKEFLLNFKTTNKGE